MANPQAENGHIDIANEIADALSKIRVSGREWQIIWVVLRKTWGWKKKMDAISKTQFSQFTGIPRRKVHEIVKGLVSKNILFEGVTQKGDIRYATYGFNKDYEKWKLSPKKVTITQKGDGVSPKKVIEVSPKKVPTKEKKETTKRKRVVFVPPTINEVISYFKSKGYSEPSAKKAFEYYETANWHDSTGKKVKNWKQKMIAVWFKDERFPRPADYR